MRHLFSAAGCAGERMVVAFDCKMPRNESVVSTSREVFEIRPDFHSYYFGLSDTVMR